MKPAFTALALLAAMVASVRADALTENVQQALKDQGFYYGEITGTKDADTTAAIRRYQIRNGLQITGELNDETLESLSVDSSGARSVVKASPTQPSVAPDMPNVREEPRENSSRANPFAGRPPAGSGPFRRDEQLPAPPDDEPMPAQPGEPFSGTPYANSPPEIRRDVITSAQEILAQKGLYRGMMDGMLSPELEFSLRAYQSRVRLPVTGRLDLGTLAALELLPGSRAPIYRPHRRPYREAPVRGEWVPEE